MTIEVLKDLGVVFSQKSIGIALRAARLAGEVPFRVLEKESGISKAQIIRMELGESEYSVARLVRLCATLGLPVDAVIDAALADGPLSRPLNGGQWPAVKLAMDRLTGAGHDRDKAIANIERAALSMLRTAAAALMVRKPIFSKEDLPGGPPLCAERVRIFGARVASFSSRKRREILIGLADDPLVTLEKLGLFDAPVIEEMALRAKFPLPDRESWALASNNLAAVHAGPKARRAMEQVGVGFVRFTDEAAKSVDALQQGCNVTPVTVTLDIVLEKVRAATAGHHGLKSALARELHVSPQQLTNWLTNHGTPSGADALELFSWVESPRRISKTKAEAAKTASAKTQPKGLRHGNIKNPKRPGPQGS